MQKKETTKSVCLKLSLDDYKLLGKRQIFLRIS